MEMTDSVIIITGSAVGIGAATAKAAAAKGARVLINYTKSETQARQTAQACRDLGGDAITCPGNIANDDDCRQIAQAALEPMGTHRRSGQQRRRIRIRQRQRPGIPIRR